MGTGSGIQAKAALENKKTTSVTAADIDENCAGKIKNARIKFIHTDLFEKVPKQKFDAITFNPPYLPQDKGIEDKTIYGGKKGHETIERFLNASSNYLSKNGIILLLFSSATNKRKIDELIENNCLEKQEIAQKKLPFFEKLHVYLIRKSSLLRQLESKKASNVKKLAEGNRGIVYTALLEGKKVAAKSASKRSPVKTSIANEAKWLKTLNKHGIGPELLTSGESYFVYKFVQGECISSWMEKSSRADAITILKSVMQQCRTMDRLKVNKEEMLRPHKHVIVSNGRPVMLDFERCRKTKNPKNVTQFCQYLISGRTSEALGKKGIAISKQKLVTASKKYKKNQTAERFNEILKAMAK